MAIRFLHPRKVIFLTNFKCESCELLTTCKCIRAAKEPSMKHKSKPRVKPIKIRVKHDVTRSLSEFWIIQIYSLHCDQVNCHQDRESGQVS